MHLCMKQYLRQYHVSIHAVCYTVLILFVLVPYTALPNAVDSLRSIIKAHRVNDTTKVNLLAQLADLYKDENIDSTMSVANANLALSYSINFQKGQARSMQQIGLAYLRKNEYDKAFNYHESALRIYEKSGNKFEQAQVLRSIADIYYRMTKYDLSIEYYNKSIAISEKINDLEGQGLALLNIGGVYSDQGNYTEALNYYFKGLKAFEKENYSAGVSMTLINIATIYAGLGDTANAREFINRSLPINEGISNKEIRCSNAINTAVVYGQLKDFRKALASFRKGSDLADSMGDKDWKNVCAVDIADIYLQMNEYDTALATYREVLHESEQIKDTTVIVASRMSIGEILIKKGAIKDGVKELLSVMDIAQKKQMKQQVLEIASDLSETYEKLHDPFHALEYYKIQAGYRDSMHNEKNDKRIRQLQYDYELGKKESQITLLNKDKLITQSRGEKQKVLLWGLIGVLVFLIIVSFQLYRSRIFEQHNKEEILKQKEEIQQQALRLENLNKFKDKTFSVLSHDLRGPLNAFSATLAMLEENMVSPDEFANLKPELEKQLNSLNSLTDSLLKWANSYITGQSAAKPELTNLNGIASRNINLAQDLIEKKKVTVISNIPTSLSAWCDPVHFDIVIRNILMNAIKYSYAGGHITLTGTSSANNIEISVTDSGVGMTPSQLSKLFTNSPERTYGTDDEKGLGMGLMLCYEFMKANNGTISATSEAGKGTTLTITVPKSRPKTT